MTFASRNRFLPIAGLLSAIAVAFWACDRGQEVAEGVPDWAYAPADTEWMTIEGVEFPAGMDQADPEILEAYLFAAKHPEVLRYMPCYCGCEHPRSAHQNNYDCFIDIIDRTGALPRVSPDPMGFS
ncbi:MAG TPA: PCYCGC motif-containing (lipo)protein [Gemmatimonadota bacterium]|nr:PCYCGC motif-containing (lipo)protein [Gemmatimonadota bacterium]